MRTLKIVHITGTIDSPFDGASVAVAHHIASQRPVAAVRAYNVRMASSTQILNELKADRPELVVFHEIYRPAFLPIAAFLRKQKIPYVVVPHGGLTKSAQAQKWVKKAVGNLLFFNRYLHGAAAVHFLSDGERKDSSFRGPSFVLPNGTDLDVRQRDHLTDPDGIRFLYLGRPEVYMKGLDLLLDAVKMKKDLLLSRGVRFSLVGPEMEEVIGPLVRERALEDLVFLRGAVTGDEKEACFAAADVFIQTSRSEGMPMGILEAIGHGVCCLVTRGTRMLYEMVENGAGNGCETEVEDIAAELEKIIADPKMIDWMGRMARELAENKYNWAKIGRAAVEKYAEIVDAKR